MGIERLGPTRCFDTNFFYDPGHSFFWDRCVFFFFFFFKYKIIYFNWRLITLQYCIGFAIHQHESVVSSWTVFSECPFRFKRGVIPPTPSCRIETRVFDLHPFCFSCSMRPCRAWMPPSSWHCA